MCSLHFSSLNPCGDSISQGFLWVKQAWRLWEPAGCLQSPRAREEGERQARGQAPQPEFGFVQNLRLSPPNASQAHFLSPFQSSFPPFSPYTHTHNVWNLQLKFPQRSLSLKNLQQKGQKSSHYGEQYEASLEMENRVPI